MVSESFYYAKRGISEENKIWGEVLSGYVSDFPQKKERKTWRSVVSYFNAKNFKIYHIYFGTRN